MGGPPGGDRCGAGPEAGCDRRRHRRRARVHGGPPEQSGGQGRHGDRHRRLGGDGRVPGTTQRRLGPARIVPRKVGPDDPELQTASVDGVLTLDTWHHVQGREAYARKVYEGLKPGGRFVVVECEVGAEVGPPKAMRVEPGQVTKQLEAAGFRVEVVRESMPRHYMVVGHKD